MILEQGTFYLCYFPAHSTNYVFKYLGMDSEGNPLWSNGVLPSSMSFWISNLDWDKSHVFSEPIEPLSVFDFNYPTTNPITKVPPRKPMRCLN